MRKIRRQDHFYDLKNKIKTKTSMAEIFRNQVPRKIKTSYSQRNKLTKDSKSIRTKSVIVPKRK